MFSIIKCKFCRFIWKLERNICKFDGYICTFDRYICKYDWYIGKLDRYMQYSEEILNNRGIPKIKLSKNI